MLEHLREEMYSFMELYGTTDKRTVAKSQQLDLEILKYMKIGGHKN